MYYFLKEDLQELNNKIAETREKIIFHEKEKHLSTTQSSETWHDNYGFEESARQIARLYGELDNLLQIKNEAKIAEPVEAKKLNIGKTIKTKNLATEEEKEFLIGSYIVFKNKDMISYESPIGKILQSAKKGKIKKGAVGNKNIIFEIIEIR